MKNIYLAFLLVFLCVSPVFCESKIFIGHSQQGYDIYLFPDSITVVNVNILRCRVLHLPITLAAKKQIKHMYGNFTPFYTTVMDYDLQHSRQMLMYCEIFNEKGAIKNVAYAGDTWMPIYAGDAAVIVINKALEYLNIHN